MLKGNVRGDRANLKRTKAMVWVFVWVFFQTSVIPLLLASLLLQGQFSDLLTVCQGARDTTTEVTRICNWGGVVSSGPYLHVVYLQPESTVGEIIQESAVKG